MERLQHKCALITGAAGGIGESIAKLFVAEGATVVVTDIQVNKLNAWVYPLQMEGKSIHAMQLDVRNEANWKTVTEETAQLAGGIDILVNNAGIFPGFVDCEATTMQQWQQIIDINLTGPFIGCKTCIPFLRDSKAGVIINIASIAGITGGNGVAYSASKGGLVMLTKDLAVTLAKDNIRVNTICPGGVRTPMTESMLSQPGMTDMIRTMSPQGRMASPEEIAWGAVYLASGESSFMTGAELVIDGGATAR